MTDSLRDPVHVYSRNLLGDVSYGVDEADLGGEEGVAGVLDQLSSLRTSYDDGWELGPVELSVESCELVGRFLVVGPHNYRVGMESVVDGCSLLQELRIWTQA